MGKSWENYLVVKFLREIGIVGVATRLEDKTLATEKIKKISRKR